MAELSRTQALKLLKEAAALNPGPWEKHSLNVALCAENIASACGMDGERAYVMGLMHDIGRRFGTHHLGHVYDGWKYMLSLGYKDIARICLTHSFCNKNLQDYIGNFDITKAQIAELETALAATQFDEYDRLIQLCDALGSADGVVDIEERMADVKARYGSYPQEKHDMNIALKDRFEKLCGHNIYQVVGKQP